MNVGAAIRISSPEGETVIRHAAEFARHQGVTCYVISVVTELPYGSVSDTERDFVDRNLRLIEQLQASLVMQEGDDVARTLLEVAAGFGVASLFLQAGSPRRLGRSIAEQLLYLDPPFDVVIVGSGYEEVGRVSR